MKNATIKSQKIVNGVRYTIEVFMMEPLEGVYRFGLQGWGRKDLFSYSMRLPEQFIVEHIDRQKDRDYLENIALKVAENHIEEMLSLKEGEVAVNLQPWFSEAKQQVEKENNKL